ncbi:MAG: SDR family oxidoreductase [Phycisphaerales bacterium]|nr:SDR family oxidoreductase [Phycisphaerales bacterium]
MNPTTTTPVLVTGAASGIGKATALHILNQGRPVIALDRSREGLDKLAQQSSGKPLTTVTCDLAQTRELANLADTLLNQHGPITALVNVAGAWPGSLLTQMSDDIWNLNFAVNVTAPFVLIRALAPAMAHTGGGAIVNISSRNAFRSSVGNAAYDASKAALVALTRTAAGELARHHIRINAICPGVIATPGDATTVEDPLFKAAYTKLIPMDRYGQPEEIVGVITFLLSNEASFMTGQALIVDGGQMACQDNQRFMQIPGLKA